MNKKRRNLLLVMILLLATVILSGCGIPSSNVLEQPNGPWETIVSWLAQLLIALNTFLVDTLGIGANSWGWAIIIFTILIKIVTLPLTLKQLQSTKAQQQMQPKMRELQEKYGKDRQKLAEEQMKLYKEAGVNPMGGCLPLLIQMPILFGLYQALYLLANPANAAETGFPGSPFYWIPDLSLPALPAPDQTAPTLPAGCTGDGCVPMVGTSWLGAAFQQQQWGILVAYLSLPILMLLTQLLVQKMAQPSKASGATQDPQARMMNQMMFFMPIMFAWITLGLPAGLTLYWTVSNLLAVIQQYFVTGWGGLADWFPFLHAKQPAWAGATTGGSSSATGGARSAGVTPARSSGNGSSPASSKAASAGATSGSTPVTASRPVEEAPEKPVKRKNRRRR